MDSSQNWRGGRKLGASAGACREAGVLSPYVVPIRFFFFFSSRRRHTRSDRDWSSDVCSSDLPIRGNVAAGDGVWKTTDGGKTWTSLGLAETQQISRVRVHPTNPDIGIGREIGRASCRERV